jgi:hypothetical protein
MRGGVFEGWKQRWEMVAAASAVRKEDLHWMLAEEALGQWPIDRTSSLGVLRVNGPTVGPD